MSWNVFMQQIRCDHGVTCFWWNEPRSHRVIKSNHLQQTLPYQTFWSRLLLAPLPHDEDADVRGCCDPLLSDGPSLKQEPSWKQMAEEQSGWTDFLTSKKRIMWRVPLVRYSSRTPGHSKEQSMPRTNIYTTKYYRNQVLKQQLIQNTCPN